MVINNLSFSKSDLESFCKNNGVEFLALFGSSARGEASEESDVDLLARFSEPKSLFELVDLEDRLSKIFGGKKTDLVTEGFLSPYIRDKVKKDLRVIYGN
ncbi:nucleotidyltransferase family protein [Candidatus Woesebacteria bacterium]|nr:nucleotidyltransferase family protein [Candidatus Woesebacteria bacterium]